METDRLGQHVFQLEKIRTQEIILRYLKSSMTLPISVGHGAYSFWLHDMGHKFIYLMQPNFILRAATKISISEINPLASILLRDCKTTSLCDEHFGPGIGYSDLLYHLQEKKTG
jgi:hypothetical protein